MSMSLTRAIADQSKRLEAEVKRLTAENARLRASRGRLLAVLQGIREMAEDDLEFSDVLPQSSNLWQIEADARVAVDGEEGRTDG